MSLFKSKFSKLEVLVDSEADKRTPAMLAAAQEELDRAGANLILVPKTDAIKDGAALDKHIENLEATAKKASEEAKKATDALAALKGQRVVDGAAGSDKGQGGDQMDEAAKAEAARQATITSTDSPWNAKAEEMGFTIPAETPKSNNQSNTEVK